MKRLFYVFLIAFALVTLVDSCKKPVTTNHNPPPPGAIVLWDNVHVIDSTQWILYSTDGVTYSYYFTPNTPNISIKIGDIIIGATNGGYIKRIASWNLEHLRLNIVTSQATMADVFKSGTFTLQLPFDSTQPNQEFIKNYSNVNIYSVSGFSANMLYGRFDISPSLVVTFSFDTTGLTNFQMSTTNTNSKDTFAFGAVGSAPRGWVKPPSPLSSISATTIKWVQAWGNISVPVVVQLGLNFELGTTSGLYYNGAPSYGVNVKGEWYSNQAFSGGLQYSAGQWQPIHNLTAYNSINFDTSSSLASSDIGFIANSRITSVFYGIPGPEITVSCIGRVTQVLDPNLPIFCDAIMATNSITDAQVTSPIFGRNIGTFNQSWGIDTVSYLTPNLLTLISGSGDTAHILSSLPNPLVVKVTDSRGNPAPNVRVTFTVQNVPSDGSIGGNGATTLNIFTDQNGLAQTTWKLGQRQWQGAGPQKVQATVFDGYQNAILGAPVTFYAYGE